jgi:hypothetical protein
MSIAGINSDSSLLSLLELYATQSADSVSSAGTSSTTASTGASHSDADSVDFSKPAEMLSKLQQLKESDPEAFKELCTKIADELKASAQNATGRDAQMLSDLAEKFQNVADGGDISQLKPPDPPSLAGAEGGVGAYQQQDLSSLSSILNGSSSTSSQTDSGSYLKQVMDNILAEIDAAVSE